MDDDALCESNKICSRSFWIWTRQVHWLCECELCLSTKRITMWRDRKIMNIWPIVVYHITIFIIFSENDLFTNEILCKLMLNHVVIQWENFDIINWLILICGWLMVNWLALNLNHRHLLNGVEALFCGHCSLT